MAPITRDEQVKTFVPDIETNDRLKLKADGYLWQKVNRRLVNRIQSGSIWTDIIIPTVDGPQTVHFGLNSNN